MGCFQSSLPPLPAVIEIPSGVVAVKTSYSNGSSQGPKRYSIKQEPQLCLQSLYGKKSNEKSHSNSKSKSNSISPALTPGAASGSEQDTMSDLPNHLRAKSQFQMKMEKRRSELILEKERIKHLQSVAFNQQLETQRSRKFQRLYDMWEEFALVNGGSEMDMEGLARALAVFGMIIDTSRDFQRHIFGKFDLDDEQVITYNDFSATVASFVGSNKDEEALQTLFEIFDIDQDGYLEIEDIARILLAQNQIALVVTGQADTSQVVYNKRQCLKQARRMVTGHDSSRDSRDSGDSNDSKINFNEYKGMMQVRTENDMLIDHMQQPSLSLNTEHLGF